MSPRASPHRNTSFFPSNFERTKICLNKNNHNAISFYLSRKFYWQPNEIQEKINLVSVHPICFTSLRFLCSPISNVLTATTARGILKYNMCGPITALMSPWVVVGKTASQSKTAGDKPGDHSTVAALLGPWVVEG